MGFLVDLEAFHASWLVFVVRLQVFVAISLVFLANFTDVS